MAAKTTGSKSSDRLKTTVKKLRAGLSTDDDARVLIGGSVPIDGKNGIKPLIRYPNSSSALRQYAAGVRQNAAAPATRLKVSPPASPPVPITPASPRSPASQPDPLPVSIEGVAAVPGRVAAAKMIGTAADLGAIIRRTRRLRDLSQAELATLSGTGRRFVSDLEGGKPTIEFARMLAVCRVLDIGLLAHVRDGE